MGLVLNLFCWISDYLTCLRFRKYGIGETVPWEKLKEEIERE